ATAAYDPPHAAVRCGRRRRAGRPGRPKRGADDALTGIRPSTLAGGRGPDDSNGRDRPPQAVTSHRLPVAATTQLAASCGEPFCSRASPRALSPARGGDDDDRPHDRAHTPLPDLPPVGRPTSRPGRT